MKVVIDIEANGLENPTQVWVIVCKNIDTHQRFIFRDLKDHADVFLNFIPRVTTWIGHNVLGYDIPVLNRLLGASISYKQGYVVDTLILSKLADYGRVGGHSIETYGEELGIPKIDYWDWSKYTREMEDYCVRDVDINEQVYHKYAGIVDDPKWSTALDVEHRFQEVVNSLHDTGFAFNSDRAKKLLEKVTGELATLDAEIGDAFRDRPKLIREVNPKLTKHGTLSRTDFRWVTGGDLSEFNGGPFSRLRWDKFNPSSHKQIIEVLHSAEWRPTDRTKSHIEAERSGGVDDKIRKYGWKVNEQNLSTLPDKAPKPARMLAKRILLESRRRTLAEWLGLCGEDGRIHGRFYAIGAWTQRMAHQQPNTANIPNEFDTAGKTKLLGKEMRQLWCAPKKRLLVGVDAEGIQLRIFAHYINDKEFTDALVRGRKEDKTDPHSLNQRVLGDHCRSRAAAKRFIYALLLGAGLGKLSEILECSRDDTEVALDRLMQRYTGFAELKRTIIPRDATRGYFVGLDGREVPIPGDTKRDRSHLCMSGYLQNGEAVVMKMATLKWFDSLKTFDAKLVNFVHDEWQVECPNNVSIALDIAKTMADSLREVGEDLKLNCPLAGSYWNDDHKDHTIGTNWYQTH